MRLLRLLAIVSFLLGVTTLAAGFLQRETERPANDGSRAAGFESFNLPAPTAFPTATVTATASQEAPASPTSTPFAGAVSRFLIPRFEVDTAVEAIGLVPGANQMDVPKDPLNVGWYDIYDRPGWAGNAVFSAHVDYWPDIRGPFFELYKLEPGDEVVVVMADGTEYRYRVFRKQRYDVSTIPTGELVWPPDKPAGTEWLTMITCGGRFRAYLDGNGAGEYLDRDVVVAARVQ